MKRILLLFHLTKKQKFVLAVGIFSLLSLFSQSFSLGVSIISSIVLAFLADLTLFLILRKDIVDLWYYSIFILPFCYTLALNLFNLLVPPQLTVRIVMTLIYAFGLYSLFLTQNIFAVSSIRTITLVRSARIVSFAITTFTFFLITSIILSLNIFIPLKILLMGVVTFILSYQLFWVYSLEKSSVKEVLFHGFVSSLAIAELTVALTFWPANVVSFLFWQVNTKVVFSVFLTGIFYIISGLSHTWIEKRLFRGVQWEYIWVGFLSILMLLIFSRWRN